MKTMTIRDLRQRWPEAEAALKLEDEIIITRDSKPVARLVPFSDPSFQRARWDVAAHAAWQKRASKGITWRTDQALAESRAERPLGGKH
jgi:antitoxin (DNA-binding transcriptional repressor) of toxin-antitoxin stability system